MHDQSMDFSEALKQIKQGRRARRQRPEEFMFLVPGSTFTVNRPPLLGIYEEGAAVNYHGHIDICMADGTIMPWVPSQDDLLAQDWCVVGEQLTRVA